jgi:phage terminase large subunit
MFHTLAADEKLYGGAAGGGKTAAIVAEGVTLGLEYPGIPVDFFRRTIPELKGTILPEIYKQCGSYIDAGHMKWQGQDRRFVFMNGGRLNGAATPGSVLNLNFLDTDNDIYRYQGREMPVQLFDELTQFHWAWIEYLMTRNRTSNPDWPVIFAAGTNPGGIGHGAVKSRYVDVGPPETVYMDPSTRRTRVYIPAKVDDHPSEAFRKSYGKVLDAISDPALRKALRDGAWNVFAGQVFTEFRYDVHTCDPFSIPEHWQRWRSMDYGNKNAILWYAHDPQNDRIYVYREYRTEVFVSVGEKSRNIRQLEAGENISYGLADPSIWNGQGDHETGKSVGELFESEGIKWIPANNDRAAGKAIVHEKLAIAADGKPKVIFFRTCTSVIRTLPDLPYDKNRTDDVDTHADDHDYDTLRYGLMAQAKRPVKTHTRPPRPQRSFMVNQARR